MRNILIVVLLLSVLYAPVELTRHIFIHWAEWGYLSGYIGELAVIWGGLLVFCILLYRVLNHFGVKDEED